MATQADPYVRPGRGVVMSMYHEENLHALARAAKRRFAEALVLLEMERATAAAYLVDHNVECMLKALMLSAMSQAQEYIPPGGRIIADPTGSFECFAYRVY